MSEQETRGPLERLPWGGDRRSSTFKASLEAHSGKTAARIAASLGVSPATIERIHAVADSDEEDIKAKLVSGELTPYAAYRMVKENGRCHHR